MEIHVGRESHFCAAADQITWGIGVGRIGSLAPTTILPQPFFRIGNSADLASSSPLRPSTMPPPPPAENKRNKKVVTGWMAEVGRRGGEFMASVLDLLLV